MLVLVSFGLVLLATILLVVGLLNDDGLTLIYLSIGASAAAAVVLYVAFRKAKPTKDADAATSPAPLADDIAPTPVDETAAIPVVETVDETPEPAVAAAPAEPEPVAPAPANAVAEADEDWMADADWEEDEVVDFPIADYDELTVGEIMPLLPQLYSDELDDVIAREQSGKNRSTIINRLEELKEIGTDADAAEAEAEAAVAAAPPPAPEPAPAAPRAALLDDDDDDDDGYFFPIADYDDLSVSQITPLLSQLEADELDEVREREMSGASRKTILSEIDRLVGGAPEPAPAPARKAAPAKKRASRAAPAKKRAATRKATKKKATTKKSTAKKARKATKKRAATRFPIADYDELTVADIRPRLTDLSDRQLELVRDREESGAGRKTILKDISNRLG